MIDLILSSLYFILPAYFANMCPVIFGKEKIPGGIPVNEKFFGAHKTWRGFYTAYIGAFIMLLIQIIIAFTAFAAKVPFLSTEAFLDYKSINPFLYAFLFGIGAAAGDLIKSFFKRRLSIKPGRPWIPFDQIDFVLGAILFLALSEVLFKAGCILPWQNILVILIATPFLHFLTNIIGYALRLKKVWW